jgi:hypothetical protein
MADDREEKLLAFLTAQLALTEYRQLVKIELEYTPASGFRADPVRAWTPASDPDVFGIFDDLDEGDDDKKDNADKIAQRRNLRTQRLVGEIIALAEDFADGYGSGTHRFCVRTHEHLHGRSNHRFKVLPGYHGEDSALEGQQLEPTQTGLVKQLMGHLENKERGQLAMIGQFLGVMKHGMETLREENEALRAQLTEQGKQRALMLESVENAKSKEHDRELELAIVMGERERKDFAVKKVVNLLPVAMSVAMRKLTAPKDGAVNGKKTKPSPIALVLQELAAGLTDEQRGQIQAVLAMEQAISLHEIIEGALDGGNLMLPALVSDLVGSLKPGQIQTLMTGVFTHEQAMLFVKAMQMAKATSAQADQAVSAASDHEHEGEGDETEGARS